MSRRPRPAPHGLTRDHLRRIVEIAHARNLSFVELVGLAELDPAVAFRGAAIRGSALKGQDLAGFDFTGANWEGCDLGGADLSRAKGVTAAMLAQAATDDSTVPPPGLFVAVRRPPWASAAGRDAFGVWAEFTLTGRDGAKVAQLMRWCRPGQFWMGSPKREPGRRGNEGPRHKVIFRNGFWMADTPCTQALWEAAMGDNPSRFKSPTRPVETVSFRDVERFLTAVNTAAPGLDLVLPSEAQWEYACRAGTKTATYAGPMEILGVNNSPVLDKIAWYGGNSGVDFELENGVASSGWGEKQYDHKTAGTHPVKGKDPNPWGLFDTLGNVEEWCADAWHDSYEGAPADGAVWPGDGAADRVLRGGSWLAGARSVRSAGRFGNAPSERSGHFGFRCARVLEQAASESGATGRSKMSRPGAERWREARKKIGTFFVSRGTIRRGRGVGFAGFSGSGGVLVRRVGRFGPHWRRVACRPVRVDAGRWGLGRGKNDSRSCRARWPGRAGP